VKINEIEARSILTKSNLPAVDLCINPYVGCAHACAYCYARFMKRFTSHTEPWGEFVDIKTNAPLLLKKRIKSISGQNGSVLLGSVTDAYQPLERKYLVTRNLLQELLKTDLNLSILTKSDLIVRDIDLLRQFKNCTVGLTITTLNDEIRAKLEPRAASVTRRIEALKLLQKNGISTYVFIGPIFPIFTDLRAIFDAVYGLVDTIWGEALNIKGGNWTSLEAALYRHFPCYLADIHTMSTSSAYWDDIANEFNSLCSEFKIESGGFYRH